MSYIIKSADELKDPFLCYCIFRSFIDEAHEDYIDYNDDIINAIPFLFWLKGRNDITNEQLENCLNKRHKLYLSDVLKDDILFPNTFGGSFLSDIKAYTLLAEYMCQVKTFRERLWDSVNDDAPNFEDGTFYQDDKGNSLACIIEDSDMVKHVVHYSEILNMSVYETFRLSYKDQFGLGINMTVTDADAELHDEEI